METSPFLDEFREQGKELGFEEGIEKGRLNGTRDLLLLQGHKKFGKAPTKKQRHQLDAIAELPQLECLAEKLLDAASWAELLNGNKNGAH